MPFFVQGALNPKIGSDGNVDKTVLRLAEHAALGFGDANDGEWPALNLDLLTGGIAVSKKVLPHIGANHGDRGAVPVLNLGKVAAIRDLSVAERRPIRGAPIQVDAGERLRSQ